MPAKVNQFMIDLVNIYLEDRIKIQSNLSDFCKEFKNIIKTHQSKKNEIILKNYKDLFTAFWDADNKTIDR